MTKTAADPSRTYPSATEAQTSVRATKSMDLTLGGVGAGTNLDYIEVISNADDGVEFFGGNGIHQTCGYRILWRRLIRL